MKFLLSKFTGFLLFLTIFFGVFGSRSARALELRDGDIILQPLKCWTCSLIEAQEKSIYSHMGIYFSLRGEDYVLESLGSVKFTPLNEFLKRNEAGQKAKVVRFKEMRFVPVEVLNRAMAWEGLSYDSEFVWNNYDENGEKLYCSELAYKLFYPYYGEALPIKRMKYDINRDLWRVYFQGDPPDGKWGNAPADFEKSELFFEVGRL